MNKPRTFIIGLEGSTFDILHPFIRAGCLPNLSQLMSQQGVYGSLDSWPNNNSASSWTSVEPSYLPE